MTRPEFSGIRELNFSGWVRINLPDSSFGFLITDLDFILYNYNTKRIMLLEIKTRNAELKTWQKNIFTNLSKWISRGIDDNWTFLGFHIIKFENTFFNDGKVYFDGEVSSEKEIKIELSCI